MCGIAGIFNLDPQRTPEPETLVAMAAIQRHRGPDGLQFQINEDRGVGFSHARLAIIDLDDSGNQPLVSRDGKLLLTHNGEFYDYQRLRADLRTRGAQFETRTDSELVLHLYRRLGLTQMLPHLRGEFAFGLYDADTDRLMLVRDRFGIKPLYWVQADDQIIFGSEIKVLFAHPKVKRAFTPEGLFHQLMQTTVPGSTPYEGVNQVRPGHTLEVTRRGGRFQIREEPYWDMPFPIRDERGPEGSEQDYVEGVRASLIEAVQHRLVADVPVGCYLSGGIDSCAMLGLAAACRQDPVKAFTIGFDDRDYDESQIAVKMANSVDADHDILRLDASHLYDHFVETHWHTERTIYNTLGVAKLLMSRHVHDAGYKVVVTGEGSDELFAGYPGFRRDLFLHGLDDVPESERTRLNAALSESNKLVSGAMLAADQYDDPALNAVCGFTPSSLQPWLNASRRVPALLRHEIRNDLAGYSPGAAIAEQLDESRIRGRHPLDIAQYVWMKTMLECQILTWGGDRVDMANSMEARPAFLDHHLAEYAATIPPKYRIKDGIEKYVLREAMRGILPEELYRREKFAFMAPPAHTDEAKYRALTTLADEYLSDEAIAASGLLDAKGVADLRATHESPDATASDRVQIDAILNHLIGVQVLHETLIEADIPAIARGSGSGRDSCIGLASESAI